MSTELVSVLLMVLGIGIGFKLRGLALERVEARGEVRRPPSRP